MSEVESKYKLPSGVDNSFPALKERLVALQPALGDLMGKALVLFNGAYAQAPHPSVAGDSAVAYATYTMNMCPRERVLMGRELTVVLGPGKWVRVFRNTDSSPNAYPRQRLWFWNQHEEANRQVNVLRTHDPSRADYPFDIETADYDARGSCLGFVGGGAYYGQERCIAEASEALDQATEIAQTHDVFLPS